MAQSLISQGTGTSTSNASARSTEWYDGIYPTSTGSLLTIPDANTLLLLTMDGTNGSTTFTDLSANGRSVTANGNAKVSTAQYKFGTGSCILDGSGDTLSMSSFSWNGGTSSFTVDFWVYFNGLQEGVFFSQVQDSDHQCYLRWRGSGLNQVDYRISTSGADELLFSFPFTPSTGTWYHVQVGRNSTFSYYAFIDGTSKTITYTTGNAATSVSGQNATFYIGGREGFTDLYVNAYIDEFRVSSTNRNASNFSVPTMSYSTPTFNFRKDWGVGNTKLVTGIKARGITTYGFIGSVDTLTVTVELYGSADASSWTLLSTGTVTDGSQALYSNLTTVTRTTAYRYHEVRLSFTGIVTTEMYCDEVEFYEGTDPIEYTGALTIVFGSSTVINNTNFYTGALTVTMTPGSTINIAVKITGAVGLGVATNSTIVIRQYEGGGVVRDPVVTGGCPQCGTYLYDS